MRPDYRSAEPGGAGFHPARDFQSRNIRFATEQADWKSAAG
jgi:hypothetical protein